jgi:large subunit ribosomal protein L15
MQIHNIQKPKNIKEKKRVGRGGKRGTYSGRGLKGQKARAGHSIPSQAKEIIQRFPKLRGVKFKPVSSKTKAVNVGDLEKLFQNDTINKEAFVKAGLIKKKSEPVKILNRGEVKKAYNVKVPVSKSAKEKIEKAGGKVFENK